MPAPTRGLLTYLAVAFGLAWAIELGPVRMVGYQQGSVGTMLWLVLVMFTPTIAAIVARRVEGGGYGDAGLRWGRGRVHLAAWLVPPAVGIASTVLVLALGLGRFDLSMSAMVDKLPPEGRQLVADQVKHFGPLLPVLVMVQALFGAVLVNTIHCFGEEFGWRAYLLPKLLPLGTRKAVLLSGVIWGLWHAPVIAMGHNYGLDYPGFPWLGILMMIWFCVTLGTLLGWLTLKEGSVWPAVIGHGAINGIAALGLLAQKGTPNTLLGPAPTGIIGGLFFSVFALALLLEPGALEPGKEKWRPEPIILPQEAAPNLPKPE